MCNTKLYSGDFNICPTQSVAYGFLMALARLLLTLFGLLPLSAYAQLNYRLKTELDSIYRVDQLYRDVADSSHKKDSIRQKNRLSQDDLDQSISSAPYPSLC